MKESQASNQLSTPEPEQKDDQEKSMPSTKTRSTATSIRKIWNEQEANLLFDVKSDFQILKGKCFDETFYEDQKSGRNLRMVLTKVTSEYLEQEKRRLKREAEIQSRRLAAFGELEQEPTEPYIPEETDNESGSDNRVWQFKFKMQKRCPKIL